jgi:hypothetical protein
MGQGMGSIVRRLVLALAGIVFVAVLWLLYPQDVRASTFTVTNCSDSGVSGDGSLRGEIAAGSRTAGH